MQTFVLRRLLALVPTLIVASAIVFACVRLIPGSVIDLMLSQNDVAVDRLSREQLVHALGLDRPVWQQYLQWVMQIALKGDFGTSLWQNVPVSDLLAQRLPVTIELAMLALLVALLVAIPIGIFAAVRQDRVSDYVLRSFSILMLAVPSFWLGTIVMVFPSIWWRWSPEMGYVPFAEHPMQNVSRLIVPAIILGTSMSGVLMRMTRTMMLEVFRQDYIRTARAKGLGEPSVVMRHALRNALIPVVTLVGLQAPLLIGGAVIIEQIFVIPGMGLLLLDAVNQRDYPIVTGVFMVTGVLVMLINLLVDLSYGLLDPKVRYG